MGLIPFLSPFRLSNREMALTKNSVRSSSWPRSKSKTDQSQTGSDTVLVTPSSTTPRDVTGEEPRSVCKSLADPTVHFLNYFYGFLSDVIEYAPPLCLSVCLSLSLSL